MESDFKNNKTGTKRTKVLNTPKTGNINEQFKKRTAETGKRSAFKAD